METDSSGCHPVDPPRCWSWGHTLPWCPQPTGATRAGPWLEVSEKDSSNQAWFKDIPISPVKTLSEIHCHLRLSLWILPVLSAFTGPEPASCLKHLPTNSCSFPFDPSLTPPQKISVTYDLMLSSASQRTWLAQWEDTWVLNLPIKHSHCELTVRPAP